MPEQGDTVDKIGQDYALDQKPLAGEETLLNGGIEENKERNIKTKTANDRMTKKTGKRKEMQGEYSFVIKSGKSSNPSGTNILPKFFPDLFFCLRFNFPKFDIAVDL